MSRMTKRVFIRVLSALALMSFSLSLYAQPKGTVPSSYARYVKRDANPLPTVSVFGPAASLFESRPAPKPIVKKKVTGNPSPNGWTIRPSARQ